MEQMLLKAHDIKSHSKHRRPLEVHARCKVTLQEVPIIQISGATEALIQESVKSDSLAETNGDEAKLPKRANFTAPTISN